MASRTDSSSSTIEIRGLCGNPTFPSRPPPSRGLTLEQLPALPTPCRKSRILRATAILHLSIDRLRLSREGLSLQPGMDLWSNVPNLRPNLQISHPAFERFRARRLHERQASTSAAAAHRSIKRRPGLPRSECTRRASALDQEEPLNDVSSSSGPSSDGPIPSLSSIC
ncbi:MAG: hypothetical protein JWL84_3688 [Rhodospirillales bacterium]|nr:hypothetical protein [Rhodospirillales bacterium]